jgi:hypothetical protein
MIYMIMESNMITDHATAVRRLAREHPDWLPVLEAAARVAAEFDEFPGAWVVDELAKQGSKRWIPNLRLLVSHGLLEKSGPSTRGGRRAYYRMPDRAEVEQALAELRAGLPSTRRLRFIGSGESTARPADAARRAGETVYEPRSWR